MELENNVQTGGRRKSFLEKLGLIEPVQADDDTTSSQEAAQAETPQTPDAISSLFSGSSPEARAMQDDSLFGGFSNNKEPVTPMHSVTKDPAHLATDDFGPKSSLNEIMNNSTQYYEQSSSAIGAIHPITEAATQKIEMLTIAEIYTLFNLKPSDDKDTIYLVENFMQALPNNLPFEVKKDSLFKLLLASSFSASELRNDGNERIRTLERYLDDFTKDLDDIILYSEEQIKMLQEKIRQHKQSVADNQRKISEQKSLIKFETQRISSLIDSIEKR